MANRRRRINLIFLFLTTAESLHAAGTDYVLTTSGRYSLSSTALPASSAASYTSDSYENKFTDYEGAFFFLRQGYAVGISMALYSSFASRAQLPAGESRFALGWVSPQVHLRKEFFDELFFLDLGTGPAHGFGAAEFFGTTNRYSRYNEWGWITSLTLGVAFKVHSDLSLLVLAEGAWLAATVRNPNMLVDDAAKLSQYFLRPGIGFALRF